MPPHPRDGRTLLGYLGGPNTHHHNHIRRCRHRIRRFELGGWVHKSRGEEAERTHAAMRQTSLSSRHESSLVLAETLASSAQCPQF
eukprot:6300026-Prymnesium_polylepis.1